MSSMQRVKDVLDVARRAQRPSDLPAALGSRIAFALGTKPVIREMHDRASVQDAADRWRRLGLKVVVGEVVVEHRETAAQAIDPAMMKDVPPWRPLDEHPVIQRALGLGGSAARMLLLSPRSPVYRWLAQRLGADQAPERVVRREVPTRARQAVYIAMKEAVARDACHADAMSGHAEDAEKLGELLGYPRCCVEAFTLQNVRYPNRVIISSAAEKTRRFEPLLNNLSLSRFVFVPHFPCRYDCQRSLVQAQTLHATLDKVNPRVATQVIHIFGLPRVYRTEDEQEVLLSARRHSDRIEHYGIRSLDEVWRRLAASEPMGAVGSRGQRRRIATGGDELVLPFGI